jgi:hypothetical protein
MLRHRLAFPARLGLALGLSLLLLGAGCNRGYKEAMLQPPGPSPDVVGQDVVVVGGERPTAEGLAPEAKGFFKADRKSGAWSREAASIEESLGVPR